MKWLRLRQGRGGVERGDDRASAHGESLFARSILLEVTVRVLPQQAGKGSVIHTRRLLQLTGGA